jgi:hypothetical protein
MAKVLKAAVAAAAVAAGATIKRVTEFALSQKQPDGELQGLYSTGVEAQARAVAMQHSLAGKTGLVLERRDCEYPLNAEGEVQNHSSKVKVTELVLSLLLVSLVALVAVFGSLDAGGIALLMAQGPAALPVRRFVGRGYTERVNFVTGQALNISASTQFSKEFKLGTGWYTMWLHFAFVFTVGTGTTALSDALWRIIRKIMLKTDRGELICNEGGRALAYICAYKTGTLPQRSTFAASNGTYHAFIPIFFSDPAMARANDTVLDTARYESIDLEVQTGGVADLLGVVGTSSVTGTLDVEVERSYGKLPEKAKPHYFISYDHRPPQDASVNPNIELEKSPDLSIKRLFLFTGDTGTAGVPWSGNANDTYPQRTNIQDQDRFIEKDRLHALVQSGNKSDASLEALLAGVEVFDWVKDRSITSALSTGEKSSLQLQLTQSGAAAGSIITATHEGIRLLKN